MKCPLSHHMKYNEPYHSHEVYEDCLEEECAWWNKANGECCLSTLAVETSLISYFLNGIRDKMHEEQEYSGLGGK